MKKLLAILLSVLMLVTVMSVSAFGVDLPDISEYESDEGVTFYALVIDASAGAKGYGYIAACGLTTNDINHRDLFTASFSEDTEILNDSGAITIDDLTQGDIIALTYSGDVLDTYPSTFLGTTRVYVVDHVDTFGEISSLIPYGCVDYGEYIPAWNDFLAKQAELDCSVSDGKVTLSWKDTSDESYTVYYKRSSSSEWLVAGTTSKHKVNIRGLKNGTSYDFKVEISGEDSETVTATPVEPTYLYAISTVSVRSEPSYEGDRWGTYSCGDKVEVIGVTDGWYEVNYPYSETSKYINASYLSEEVPDGTAEDEPLVDVYTWDYGTFVVIADTTVYSDIVNGEVLGTLEAGETVEAIGKVYIDDLSLYAYKISYNGEDAYVDKDALTDPDFDAEPNEIDSEDLADRGRYTYDDSGEVEICVVSDSITSTSATFKICNSSDYMVTHGEDFRLQVYSDGEWSDVEFIVDSYEVVDLAWMVYAGGNISEFKANWSYFYGELPVGHYRFVLEYTYQTDDGAVNVYGVCGFDID